MRRRRNCAYNVEEPGRLADLVVSNLQLRVSESQAVLETFDPALRLKKRWVARGPQASPVSAQG